MAVGLVPIISLYTFSQSNIDKLAQALCKAGALNLSDCTPICAANGIGKLAACGRCLVCEGVFVLSEPLRP